jgi:CDP-diacylglycerol--serine O-phosphatidyltransferase
MKLQRGVIILPSALTLANLFFGLWAVVAASRGQFMTAGWLIVWAALFDTFDGRVARYTQTGSRFGEEMDSLVDAISFGVAPSLVLYHQFLRDASWGWVACFFYVAAAVIRLARFNVEQAGHAKAVFHGLPSPSAGIALATFYPFSQTDFFQLYLSQWRWPSVMIGIMVVLGFLMLSHVPYAVVPKFGFSTLRGILNFVFLITMTVLAIAVPRLFFFPAAMSYITYGILKAIFLGFFERLPDQDPLLDQAPDEAGAELRVIDYAEITPHRRFRLPGYRRRRRRDRRRPPDRNLGDKPPDQKPKEAP